MHVYIYACSIHACIYNCFFNVRYLLLLIMKLGIILPFNMAAEFQGSRRKGKQRHYRLYSHVNLPASDAQQSRKGGNFEKGPWKKGIKYTGELETMRSVHILSPCLHILTHPTHAPHCSETADNSKTLKEQSSTRRQNTD